MVIKQVHYLLQVEDVELESGVGESLKKLAEAGFMLIVVTNQSGVARGMFSLADVEKIHAEINRQLQSSGVKITAFYTCPHHPDHDIDCDCRKPKPGLILRAAADYDINLRRSYMCGDKAADVVCGRNAGCRNSYLVLSGYGETEKGKLPPGAPVVADFSAFAAAVLGEDGQG